ncbi:lasso peptide isopeptide bond-forming cyclase [Streptomyces qinglanensis]|nr:lasso peptide isopeptide bond-forming cyclase [Streptomyces qinglanensis]
MRPTRDEETFMGHHLALSTLPAWFVVLPDTDAAVPVARRAADYATRIVRHESGRPWLLGRWEESGSPALARAGNTRIAVFGEHEVTAAEAERAAAHARRSEAHLDRLVATWRGSFHVIASSPRGVRVQGSVVGLRRVFHASPAASGRTAVCLAADRADIVAELSGAELDERQVALQLLTSGVPHPLGGAPLWRGVHTVPGGHRLLIREDGPSTYRWWRAPQPTVGLDTGARILGEELVDAVKLRARGRSLVSADLGGLDSTAICSAAAGTGTPVAAYTAGVHDEAGDDVYWAERTVGSLHGVEHHVIRAGGTPMTFAGIATQADILDTPTIIAVDRARRMDIIERAAKRGSALHLTGLGGDELLAGSPARLHELLPRAPLHALRTVRGFAAKYHWSHVRVAAQLLDRGSYRSWLARTARDLTTPPAGPDEPLLDWAGRPRMPTWATPDAVLAARSLLLEGLGTVQPRGPGHGEHRELVAMDGISQWCRHIGQMAAPHSLTVSAPYYDHRVIEAALSVRIQERITPWRYKPLIVEAARGIVPESSRTRDTKANATYEEEAGLRRHRSELLQLCEDSRLARLGLVDEATLRRWCERALAAETESYQLHPTVACEVWLRARETPAMPPTRTVDPGRVT